MAVIQHWARASYIKGCITAWIRRRCVGVFSWIAHKFVTLKPLATSLARLAVIFADEGIGSVMNAFDCA
jgi:hypothetical protein